MMNSTSSVIYGIYGTFTAPTRSVLRAIDRWGNVSRRILDPKSVNDIVKQRVALAGLEAAEFSAHGLRLGYLT